MKFWYCIFFLFLLASCEKDDFVYEYPETDKLLISVTNTQPDYETRTEFLYDDSNRLIEVKNIYPEASPLIETYKYNPAGQLVEKVVGDYTTSFIYNSSGQVVEQNVHYKVGVSGYEWNQKTEFQYKNGKIYKGIEYSREGEILNYISYKYDSRGNMLEKVLHSASNEYDYNI